MNFKHMLCELRDFGRYFSVVVFEDQSDIRPLDESAQHVFHLTPADAQKLMNGLWCGGVRPEGFKDHSLELEELKARYFTDMRKLALCYNVS